MPFRVLVVKTDAQSGGALEESLIAAGYHVTSATGFEDAKPRVLSAPPDILISDLRLGAYSGVHLLVYAHASRPSMPGIIIDVTPDAVLEKDVRNEGGVYVGGPCSNEELLGLVGQLTGAVPASPSVSIERESTRKHLALTATAEGAPVKIVDVSFQGLRLEIPGLKNDQIMRLTTVEVPSIGVLEVRPVWVRSGASTSWCWVEVVSADPRTAAAWRTFVASLH